MERLSKCALVLFLSIPLGCGVKGRPLPPLNPAPIGRGEPALKETDIKRNLKKKNPSDTKDEIPPVSESEE